jgi:3-oxoacyl-[acyl-carrier protein] reductase
MDNVLVTGASRGIGLAIAERLAADGFQVIAVSRKGGRPAERILPVAYDLGDVAGIPDFVRGLRQQFGPLYGLVNNAGLGTEGLLATMPDPDIEALIRLNTLSPIMLTKYVA